MNLKKFFNGEDIDARAFPRQSRTTTKSYTKLLNHIAKKTREISRDTSAPADFIVNYYDGEQLLATQEYWDWLFANAPSADELSASEFIHEDES